jgi:alpha-mannosidase
LRDFVQWESRRDRGDLYTPAIREAKLTPRLLNTRLLHRGPLRASVEQRWRLRDAENRIDVRVRFVLDAGARWLRVYVVGVNAARDHRLRLRFATDVDGARTFADAAFAIVERHAPRVSEQDALVEEPVLTAPLHRYVSLFNEQRGATVFADGLTEYETDGSSIAVTILRSVGELSRSDIAERPGHAGWPAPTPEAQCIGSFEADLALMLHGRRDAAMIDAIERGADDVLYPLTGDTLRSAVKHHPPMQGVALEGVGLSLSAIKESEDGEFLVLRCVNLLDQDTAGTWRLARAPANAHLARLDETLLTPLKVSGETVPFLAPAHGIVTVMVR